MLSCVWLSCSVAVITFTHLELNNSLVDVSNSYYSISEFRPITLPENPGNYWETLSIYKALTSLHLHFHINTSLPMSHENDWCVYNKHISIKDKHLDEITAGVPRLLWSHIFRFKKNLALLRITTLIFFQFSLVFLIYFVTRTVPMNVLPNDLLLTLSNEWTWPMCGICDSWIVIKSFHLQL